MMATSRSRIRYSPSHFALKQIDEPSSCRRGGEMKRSSGTLPSFICRPSLAAMDTGRGHLTCERAACVESASGDGWRGRNTPAGPEASGTYSLIACPPSPDPLPAHALRTVRDESLQEAAGVSASAPASAWPLRTHADRRRKLRCRLRRN